MFRQHLITQCIWYKVKICLLKHCVLNLFSENIWNWQIIFTFNLIILILLITIPFCAYLNSHLSKLWRRRMNMGVGELWKSHPIGPEGWLDVGGGGGGQTVLKSPRITYKRRLTYPHLCAGNPVLWITKPCVYFVDRLWRLWKWRTSLTHSIQIK